MNHNFSHRDQQVDGITGQKFTCAQLRSRSIRLAERMSELFDLKAGDVVGICSENRLEFAVTVYATILLGATVAPVNVIYTERNDNDNSSRAVDEWILIYTYFRFS